MTATRRQILAAAAATLAAPAVRAQASGWPSRPVRLIVPFPPGGGTDAFARPLAKVLSQNLGQQMVIDNRGGAGGTLGAELAAKSVPDGYTFLVGAVHHTIAVSMYPKLGYELQKDLLPVTVLSQVPNVVVVNPQRVPARSFAEFQAYVRANPGRLNYASAGNGTTHHLTVELWKTLTRSFATHIPYRGAGPALQDLLAGQVDFMFDGLGSAIPHIKAGKLVPLAVTSAQRSPALPDVPTLDEAGVKGYSARTWYALWAPAGTPRDIVLKMQQETARALAGAELRGIWQGLGAESGGQPPDEMAKLVDAEIAKWAKVVRDSGARLD
jgi:tripartite-type tricarboxylate transporter receptor subunit TctC